MRYLLTGAARNELKDLQAVFRSVFMLSMQSQSII